MIELILLSTGPETHWEGKKSYLQLLCLVNWLIDNRLTKNLGTNRTLVRVKDGEAWTTPLPNTGEWVPSAISTGGNLLERFNEISFYLIPIKAPKSSIQGLWGEVLYGLIPEKYLKKMQESLSDCSERNSNWRSISYSSYDKIIMGDLAIPKWVAVKTGAQVLSLEIVSVSTSCVHLGRPNFSQYFSEIWLVLPQCLQSLGPLSLTTSIVSKGPQPPPIEPRPPTKSYPRPHPRPLPRPEAMADYSIDGVVITSVPGETRIALEKVTVKIGILSPPSIWSRTWDWKDRLKPDKNFDMWDLDNTPVVSRHQ